MSADERVADIERLRDRTIDLAVDYARVCSGHFCSREYVALGDPGFTPEEQILHSTLHGLERLLTDFVVGGLNKTLGLIQMSRDNDLPIDQTGADISIGGLTTALRAIGIFTDEMTHEERVFRAAAAAYAIVGAEAINDNVPGSKEMFGFLTEIMKPPSPPDESPSPRESPN